MPQVNTCGIFYIDFEINKQNKRLNILKNIDMYKKMVAVNKITGTP
jgi:hypothetical protein